MSQTPQWKLCAVCGYGLTGIAHDAACPSCAAPSAAANARNMPILSADARSAVCWNCGFTLHAASNGSICTECGQTNCGFAPRKSLIVIVPQRTRRLLAACAVGAAVALLALAAPRVALPLPIVSGGAAVHLGVAEGWVVLFNDPEGPDLGYIRFVADPPVPDRRAIFRAPGVLHIVQPRTNRAPSYWTIGVHTGLLSSMLTLVALLLFLPHLSQLARWHRARKGRISA
jgi:hypothetical protein